MSIPWGGARSHRRVLRGGAWNNDSGNCRPANRNRNAPGDRNNNIGFRPCFRLHFATPARPAAPAAGGSRTAGERVVKS